MANRYEDIELLKTELGKRYKKTIRYPKMEKTPEDRYIITIQGDRLDNLAYKYYNDSLLWWIIARANDLNSIIVPENIQLRIPGNKQYAKGK